MEVLDFNTEIGQLVCFEDPFAAVLVGGDMEPNCFSCYLTVGVWVSGFEASVS